MQNIFRQAHNNGSLLVQQVRKGDFRILVAHSFNNQAAYILLSQYCNKDWLIYDYVCQRNT